MPEETLRYDPDSGSWRYPAHWDDDTTGLSAELDRRIAATHERRVLAALEVLGWPDDRERSAHIEPDGAEVTPAGHYWSFVEEILAAADQAGTP